MSMLAGVMTGAPTLYQSVRGGSWVVHLAERNGIMLGALPAAGFQLWLATWGDPLPGQPIRVLDPNILLMQDGDDLHDKGPFDLNVRSFKLKKRHAEGEPLILDLWAYDRIGGLENAFQVAVIDYKFVGYGDDVQRVREHFQQLYATRPDLRMALDIGDWRAVQPALNDELLSVVQHEVVPVRL